MMVRTLLLPVLLLGLAACAARGATPSDAAPATWIVASDLDNLPFAGIDEGGRPVGRDVEMMQELAGLADVRLVWERVPFEALLDTLERGEADVVCATLGATPGRRSRVAFTQPYFRTEIAVVLRAGFGAGPALARRLAGRPVHAARGTTSELAVRRFLPAARLAEGSKDGLAGAERLLAGEVDALVMDGPAARALAAARPGLLVVAEEVLTREDYALAVPLGRDELLEVLDRGLAELEARGRLAELDARHGLRVRTGSR